LAKSKQRFFRLGAWCSAIYDGYLMTKLLTASPSFLIVMLSKNQGGYFV
jgi:hypothetical protein